MLNQVCIVGTLEEMPKTKEYGSKKLTTMTLKCKRNFSNTNGEFESDIIPVSVWKSVSELALEKLEEGDVITVSGRVQSRVIETKEGKTFNSIEVIGEKVSFVN